MRKSIDKMFQAAIRLCMLTGVTFLVTACYGVAPEPRPDMDEELNYIEQTLEDSLTNDDANRD